MLLKILKGSWVALIGGSVLIYNLPPPVDSKEVVEKERGKKLTPLEWPADMRARMNLHFLNGIGDFVYRFSGKELYTVKCKEVESALEELESIIGEEDVKPMRETVQDLNDYHSMARGRPSSEGFLYKMVVLDLIRRRTQVEKEFIKHEEDMKKVERVPEIIITGQPRTGSTLLHKLLSRDPSCRHLTGWEQQIPLPFPTDIPSQEDMKRRRACEKRQEMFDRMIMKNITKYYRKCHDHDGADLEEEYYLLMHALLLPTFGATEKDSVHRSYFRPDKHYAYEYLKKFLTLSQHYHPARSHFVLKCPQHAFHIDELVDVFGDTCTIVVTHRDPLKTVPSMAQLMQIAMALQARDVKGDGFYSKEIFGEGATEWCKRITDNLMRKEREMQSPFYSGKKPKFVHVQFNDIVRDPIGVARRIYSACGLEWTRDGEAAMRAYIRESEERRENEKMGSVHFPYMLEQFALDESELRETFKEYRYQQGYA